MSPHADAFILAACKSKSLATTRRSRSVSRDRHPPSQLPTSSLHASRHRKTSKSKTDRMALVKDDPMALLALAIQQTLNRVGELGDETRIYRESSSLYQRERDCLTSLKPYRDGESIVHFLDKVDCAFEKFPIPEKFRIEILIQKLSSKVEHKCHLYIKSSTVSYEQLKQTLIKHIGADHAEAVCRLFSNNDLSDKHLTESGNADRIVELLDRFLLSAESKPEIMKRLVAGVYKFKCHRPFSHKVDLYNKSAVNHLPDLTMSFDSQIEQDRAFHKQKQSFLNDKHPRQDRPTCTFCSKVGHTIDKCFKKHKDLKPKDNDKDGEPSKPKNSFKPTKHVKWAALTEEQSVVLGQVNQVETEMVAQWGPDFSSTQYIRPPITVSG